MSGELLSIRPLSAPLYRDGSRAPTFPATHPYIERCWLPLLGPSATWCLRRLAAALAVHPEGTTLDLGELGRDLGLGEHAGRRAPLARALRRLSDFGLARTASDGTLEVRTELPPLGPTPVRRLGTAAAVAHREMVAEASNPLLAAALAYARRGWPVFPLQPGGKAPNGRLAPHGLNDATTDEQTVRGWWAASPRANVAIRTGAGLDVVDLDSPAARDALLDGAPEPLPPSIVVRTARGWHLWFAASGLQSRAAVAEGLDVRGSGGYVVAPPSLHPNGQRYQFLDARSGELSTVVPDVALSPAPAWLVERLRPPVRERAVEAVPVRLSTSHYVAVALESECSAVAATPEGARNHRLNRAAFSLGTLVGAEALDASEARAHLLEAALRAGLDEREATRTIASGLEAGARQPRRIDTAARSAEPESRATGHTEGRAGGRAGGRAADPFGNGEPATKAVLARARRSPAQPSPAQEVAPASAVRVPRRDLRR